MAAIFDFMTKEEAFNEVFDRFDTTFSGELTAPQLQELHSDIRDGGVSLPQVEASINAVCACDTCDRQELVDVLNEMDRRYFLVRDLQWEFAMLDREQKGTISEKDGRFLFQAVHDEYFSHRRWVRFLRNRVAPGTGISFAEIEVPLCDIPTRDWLEEDKGEEDKERQEYLRKKAEKEKAEEEKRKRREAKEKMAKEESKRKEEAARRRAEEDEAKHKAEEAERQRKQELLKAQGERKKEEEDAKRRAEEEAKKAGEEDRRRAEEDRRREEEETRRREEEEAARKWKKEELRKQQELERQKLEQERLEREQKEREEAMEHEDLAEEAAEAEAEAAEAARKAAEAAKAAQDEESRKAAQEAEKKALAQATANKEKRLRANLKAAKKSRKEERLNPAIKDAKTAKMPALKPDIDDAEETLKSVKAGQALKDAIKNRNLGDLEKSIAHIRKSGYEKDWGPELTEGEKLVHRLKRLEKLKAEILELKQSTISEIRSYGNPPPAVHKVMISVYLLLGYPEKELLVWKNMQALLGKTGKDGLKRQVTQVDPLHIEMQHAVFANDKYLEKLSLETIRDVSAGAATFYVWATNMIEEVHAVAESKERLLEEERKRKKEEAEEKKRQEERKKAKDAAKRQRLGGPTKRESQQQGEGPRGRSTSRGRDNRDNLSKSPAAKRDSSQPGRKSSQPVKPGVAKRTSNSKSPARS